MPTLNPKRFELTLDRLTIHDIPPGSRLDTIQGKGRLNYVRMAPPDYHFIAAVSVILDTSPPGHNGTIFPASMVRLCRGCHSGERR